MFFVYCICFYLFIVRFSLLGIKNEKKKTLRSDGSIFILLIWTEHNKSFLKEQNDHKQKNNPK